MFRFDVSFIIPAQKISSSLIPTLDSIYSQDSSYSFEVIVVLGQEENLSYEREISIIRAPKINASSARNLGIAEAVGEFIALIDSDTVLEKHWLNTLMKEMKSGPWFGAQGRIRTSSQNDFGLFSEFRKLSSFASDDALILGKYPLPILNSAACLYRRNPNLWFDPSLFAGEDIELSWRCFHQNSGGFYYSSIASADCYYSSEKFIDFFIRNFRLGLSLGKIIQQQDSIKKGFRKLYLSSMRQYLRIELKKSKEFSPLSIIARFCASMITNVTCHFSSYFPNKKPLLIDYVQEKSPITILLNNQKIGNNLKMVAFNDSIRIIDLNNCHDRYYYNYEIIKQHQEKFLIICLDDLGEKN